MDDMVVITAGVEKAELSLCAGLQGEAEEGKRRKRRMRRKRSRGSSHHHHPRLWHIVIIHLPFLMVSVALCLLRV